MEQDEDKMPPKTKETKPPKPSNSITPELLTRLHDDLDRVEAILRVPESKLILKPLCRITEALNEITESVNKLYDIYGVPLYKQCQSLEELTAQEEEEKKNEVTINFNQ